MTDKEKLMEIYENTIYEISNLDYIIKIKSLNKKIDEIVEKYDKLSWAFITASNPFSIQVSEVENQQNFERLTEQVSANYIKYYVGIGKGQENWCDEKSLFIIGITETQATNLGKLFGQNAIVLGSIGSTAKVKWIKD